MCEGDENDGDQEGRYELKDEEWERIQKYFPEEPAQWGAPIKIYEPL